MSPKIPAEVFSPGEILKDELDARGWSQSEFAEIIGRPIKTVNEIIAGKKRITPTTALELEAALGISARAWMNHDAIYQLHNEQPPPERIKKEAKLRSLYSVRAMVARGWLESSENPDVTEGQLLRFFEIQSIGEKPDIAHAARRSESLEELTPDQLAWMFRVKQLAKTIEIENYSESKLSKSIELLSSLRNKPEQTAKISDMLAGAGVRFLIVEPLAGSKIDGACMWVNKKTPVIAMTLRFDRIDNFWFVLRHELEHVLQRHGKGNPILDSELDKSADSLRDGNPVFEEEALANQAAAEFCICQSAMDNLIAESVLVPSRKKVMDFAAEQGVHPGIVAGQLQRKLNRCDIFRNQLVKVREYATSTALTDGYGQTKPVLV